MRFDTGQITAHILAGEKALLLLDSDCLLCNNLARWLSQRDKRGSLLFASIADYKSAGAATPENTALLLTNGKIYTRSAAVLAALQKLGGPWILARFFLDLIPATIRDFMYDFIADRRLSISSRLMSRCRLDNSLITPRVLDKNELLSLLLSLTNSGTKQIFCKEMENHSYIQT